MRWQAFIGHGVFLLSMGVTLVVLLGFKLWHRHSRRRAPLQDRQVGHLPGQQLQTRIDHHQEELSFGVDMMIGALPIMFLIWATLRIQWETVRIGFNELIFLIGWLSMLAWGFLMYRKHYRLREQARDGLLAERVTGMQLNRLLAQGCTVMHDLPAVGFNIDHVVIAPRGVYAVETKSFRKPKGAGEERHRVGFDGQALRFPDFINTDAPAQAIRQAQWLAREIRSATGTDCPVTAALALPGWYIVQDESVWRTAAVKVFSPMGEGSNFMAKGAEVLTGAERAMVSKALALRYPRIED